MHFTRAAGVLVHPTSFPSRYGIGDLGDAAYRFVNFLIESKQSLWQILPLGPTSYGDSPYQAFSAFAGNPLLISPDRLVKDGFLPQEAVADVPDFPQDQVDYGWVINYKIDLLTQSYRYWLKQQHEEQHQAFDRFCEENAFWLDDFTLFMALKNEFVEHEGGVWNTWPDDIAHRQPAAMERWSKKLAEEIHRQKFWQFLFFGQWLTLKSYANEKGIDIIGDIPIFVAFDSADVWANPDLFYLEDDGSPSVIAGVPPDYFSETGQRWGNPLYRWNRMRESNYAWWTARLDMTLTQVDRVRIDHFRGFDAYWEIPASEPTAVVGRWVKGPGAAFFEAVEQNLGELPLIAEDLGVITPAVEALRDRFDFPGMKVLQFAFGGERNNNFLPHNYPRNCVVYTGTHDNETTLGWFKNASEEERRHAMAYMNTDASDISFKMVRLAYMSVADTAVVPLQDLMGLSNEARMNFPGRASGNWQWRYRDEMLTENIKNRLLDITWLYGRTPEQQEVEAVPDLEVEEA